MAYNSEASLPNNEPGAEDNRLSLNPNDDQFASVIGEWEDGNRYTVTLEVEQMAPGEFRVLSAHDEGAEPDAGEESNPSHMAEEKGEGGGKYPNPAVARMMESEGT